MPVAVLAERATRGSTTRPAAPRTRSSMADAEFLPLLTAVREGDEAGFSTLWRALNPPLVRYLRVVARDQADDLAAEVWLDVVRGLDRFDGDEADFRAWCFTIARHRHADWCRAEARRRRLADAVRSSPADESRADDAAHAVETADATARALRLIARLPSDQSEVVALRVIADLDVAEVARIVEKRPGTVRVLAHRGLRRLAEILEGDEIPAGV